MTPPRVSKAAVGVALLVLAACVAAAAFFTSRQRPLYLASTTLVVVPNSSVTDTGDVLRSLDTLERRTVIATFARIPTATSSQRAVAARLGLQRGLGGCRIEALVLPNTNILRIDVEGPDAQRVSDVADAMAAYTRRRVRSLYRIFTLRQLAEASVPTRPFFPDPRRNLLVGAVLGAFLGVLAAALIDRLRAPAAKGT